MPFRFKKNEKDKGYRILMDMEYDSVLEQLPPGVYTSENIGGLNFIPMLSPIVDTDNLVKFSSGIIANTMGVAEKFLSPASKKAYKDLKVGHKMGIIFHGKQGIGKTATCKLIMNSLVEKYNAIAIDGTSLNIQMNLAIVEMIRTKQDNPVVLFMDEFEDSYRRNEGTYLTFLDGNTSITNLIFMGCTNYIEKLPPRITNRRSRIKYIFEISSLPLSVYQEYIDDRLPDHSPEVRGNLAKGAEACGLTLDNLKHALIDFVIEGLSVEEALFNASSDVIKASIVQAQTQIILADHQGILVPVTEKDALLQSMKAAIRRLREITLESKQREEDQEEEFEDESNDTVEDLIESTKEA